MSSMMDIGRLSMVVTFSMRTIVSSLDGLGMMRWIRENQ